MIDFIIMRREQRKFCSDVRVVRGACCWSDHHMVRSKVRLNITRKKGKPEASHTPISVHLLSEKDKMDAFRQKLDQSLLDLPYIEGHLAERNWEVFKQCIMTTAEECIGRKTKRQPDWFIDLADTLMPLVNAKWSAHERYLKTNNASDKKEFRKHQ